jgi:hypothetical protein
LVDPKYFLRQIKSDMEACNLLSGAGNYGNAAYHLQQAVEKHAKYVLLHGRLMPEGKKTHLPVPAFLEEFVTGMADFKTIAQKYNIQIFDSGTQESLSQFLDQTRIIMKALAEGKPSFLSALWKNSLNIPLVDKQEDISPHYQLIILG